MGGGGRAGEGGVGGDTKVYPSILNIISQNFTPRRSFQFCRRNKGLKTEGDSINKKELDIKCA